MEKKDLKFYETPVVEIEEMEVEAILAGSPGDDPEDVKDEEIIIWDN